MQETQVQSLGQEDPLEKGMATHSSILAWEILQRSLVGYSPWGCRVGHDWETNSSTLSLKESNKGRWENWRPKPN